MGCGWWLFERFGVFVEARTCLVVLVAMPPRKVVFMTFAAPAMSMKQMMSVSADPIILSSFSCLLAFLGFGCLPRFVDYIIMYRGASVKRFP